MPPNGFWIQKSKMITLIPSIWPENACRSFLTTGCPTFRNISSLVAVEICAMDDVFGRMQGLLRENGTGKAFTIVYEVPDKALESLRGSAEK